MAGKGKPGPLGGQTNSGNADGGDRAKAPNSGSGPSAAGSFFAKAADSMASAVDAVSTTLRVKGEDLEHGIRSNLEGAYCIYAAGIQAESYAPDAILEETGCQIATLISGLKSSFIQMLEIVGATSVLGAGIGGAVGLFCGGATAVPGLVIGGELGYDVGMAALTWLGLGFLVYAITGGFAELYKALHEGVEWAWQARDLKGAAQKEQLDKAAHKIADAAGILMRLVLQGIVAELLRRAAISSGRGALARGKALGNAAAEGTDAAFIAQLRDSSFGRPFADWIEKNKADLEKNPKLQAKADMPQPSAELAPEGGGGKETASGGGGRKGGSSTPKHNAEDGPEAATTPPPKPPAKFVGKLGSKQVEMDGVSAKRIEYEKRPRPEYSELRKQFDSGKRQEFLENLASDPQQVKLLKDAGISETGLQKMQDGRVPDGWQVHHKLPLDDGGTNDPSNLVLIKNVPAHQVLTNAQSALVGDLKVGQGRTVDFPVPDGKVYPPDPSMVRVSP